MKTDGQKSWDLALEEIKGRVEVKEYGMFFARLSLDQVESDHFRVQSNLDGFAYLWFQKNYETQMLKPALEKHLGRKIKLSVLETPEEENEPQVAARQQRRSVPAAAPAYSAQVSVAPPQNFNPRFTFDNFVTGEETKFAIAAARAVAECPGHVYNPLFIYGGTGLGKTHMMQAMAQEALVQNPRLKVEYLTSEEFTNRFIEATQKKSHNAFRNHFRSLDLLLIDDIQFLKGKAGTQEEFFHTFNKLFSGHKQIVLASDRAPADLDGLEKRLVSRFEHGQIVDVYAPDYETRVAILRQKQQSQKLKLSNELIDFIAQNVRSNVRRLEGALTRLVSYASVAGRELSLEDARRQLAAFVEEEAPVKRVTIQVIQRRVAEHFDITLKDLLGSRRPANIAFPRQVAMYLSRELTGESLPSIGDSFNRNHATVLHAVNTVKGRLTDDENLRSSIISIKNSFQNSTGDI